MSTPRLLAWSSALLLVGVLTSCSSEEAAPAKTDPTATYGDVTAGTLTPGDPVPAPTGKVVLTLRHVPTTNVGRTLQFDLATLEQLDQVTYEVYDRQAEGRDVTFSGPLLRTVLAVAGVEEATTLYCTALNDYTVEIPGDDATDLPVMLATRADGEEMTVAHYGPTRVIYPTEGIELDETVYDPRWIWQLDEISVDRS